MKKLILLILLSSTFCKAQNPYQDLLIPIVDTGNTFLDNYIFVPDTSLILLHLTYNGEVITRIPNDTIAAYLLISFRGLAIVIDGYAAREHHYDYFAGGIEYFNVTSYLDEGKKPLDKTIQVWQHKFK